MQKIMSHLWDMGMKRGYIRLSKAGPSLEDQQKALERAGINNFSEGVSVFVDPPLKRGDPPTWLGRTKAIQSLRPGDELVVSSASRLGTTMSDVLGVLRAVGERQASILVADSGHKVAWHPDALAAVEFAQGAELENRREVAATARAAQAATGRVGGAPKQLHGEALEKAKRLWADQSLSAAEVAERVGVTTRTLYRRLGERLKIDRNAG